MKLIQLIEASIDHGDCYKSSYRKITSMSDAEAEDVMLVHGEVIGRGSVIGKSFGHAWLEKNIKLSDEHSFVMVIDCSNNINIELPREFYYQKGGIVDQPGKLFRYTQHEAQLNGIRSGHYGSWELDIEK